MEGIDDLLRPPDRERRDNDLALALQGYANHPAHLGVRTSFRRVLPCAVRALHLEVIHILHRLRIAQDVVITAPNIAAEQKTELAPVLADIEDHLGRPQDMARVAESHRNAVGHRERPVVVDADKLTHHLVGVPGSVKRFDGRETSLGALLRYERGVVPLDLGGILEHDAGQVAGGKGAVDVSLKTLAAKVRQVATVVDVRVPQHHCVNTLRVERKASVALDGFATPALKQAALQQQPLSINLTEIHRSGRRAVSAEEVNAHGY